MKNKKWLLLVIIVFPSLFWLILESSTINSKKLPHYGPKKIIGKGDTIFHQVPDNFFTTDEKGQLHPSKLSRRDFPLYAIIFINRKYRNDVYRIAGLWEYLKYKKDKVEYIPFVLVTECDSGRSNVHNELTRLSDNKNVHFYEWPAHSFDSITKVYFKEKPYYIDYSFFILIDPTRNVRGYYDGRYVAELKRLIEEYQHLRLKEEKQLLIQANEISTEP